MRVRLISIRSGMGDWNTGYSITVLLILLVLLNLCGVWVYAEAHPGRSSWEWVWSYLQSQMAALISASLVLPLLVFIIERRFNLLETVRAARSERRLRAQDARREVRVKVIEQTSQLWSRITNWVSDVAYWNGSQSIDGLLKEGVELTIAAEEVINGWARFRNVVEWSGSGSATDLEPHFLRLANTLIHCTRSTIYYLQETCEPGERDELQTSLLVITNGIDIAVNHSLRNVLYASLELMDIVESESTEELRFISSKEEEDSTRKQLETTIDQSIAQMAGWSAAVKVWLDRSGPLATVSGQQADALRSGLDEDAATLRETYLAIPRSERLQAWRLDFTKPWLAEFADEMAFQVFCASLDGSRSSAERQGQSSA